MQATRTYPALRMQRHTYYPALRIKGTPIIFHEECKVHVLSCMKDARYTYYLALRMQGTRIILH